MECRVKSPIAAQVAAARTPSAPALTKGSSAVLEDVDLVARLPQVWDQPGPEGASHLDHEAAPSVGPRLWSCVCPSDRDCDHGCARRDRDCDHGCARRDRGCGHGCGPGRPVPPWRPRRRGGGRGGGRSAPSCPRGTGSWRLEPGVDPARRSWPPQRDRGGPRRNRSGRSPTVGGARRRAPGPPGPAAWQRRRSHAVPAEGQSSGVGRTRTARVHGSRRCRRTCSP